jgi:predicted Zn finger-like uncharacterized protein
MFTVCPKCALTLVVTAADLRVAQGYVRCGRCSSVFNALARLTEERQGTVAEPAALPEAEPPPADAAPAASPASAAVTVTSSEELIPETALEFDPATTDVNSVFVQAPPDPQWTAATGSFKAMVAANQEATEPELPDSQVDVEIDAAFLASMMRAESVTAEVAPARAPSPATAPPAPRAAARAPVADEASPAAAPAGPQRTPAAARAAAGSEPPQARAPLFDKADPEGLGLAVTEEHFVRATAAASVPLDEETAEGSALVAALPRRHAWSIGAALAALLLLAQIVNHYRDEWAANPRFTRPLTSLYGVLGVKLFPRWDLHAYEVRQQGASAGGGGTGVITVRASIKNAAPQPQPLPLLRVTLQDQFGNRIAARDVQPKAYLPGVIPPSSFLSAGQRIDAEMGFADPGADAVGFEIDACLPARGGGIACANDVALR